MTRPVDAADDSSAAGSRGRPGTRTPAPAVAPSGPVARVPMRISFAGGGTDLPSFFTSYGGEVLSLCIDRYLTLTAIPGDARTRGSDALSMRLLQAAAARLGVQTTGIGGLETACDVAPGSGLGGSSALAVAAVGLAAGGRALPPAAAAEVAYQAERIDLGMTGGLQDHYAAAFGGFNHIRFSADGVRVEPVNMKESTLDRLAGHLVLCPTGITRESMRIIADQERRIARDDSDSIKALLRQRELISPMRVALEKECFAEFGDLLHIAWTQKRRISPLVSNTEIDDAYELARRNGALGGKICGAGSGGYLLLCCAPGDRARLAGAMAGFGWPTETVRPEPAGLRIVG